MPSTFNWIYLGPSSIFIDPTEGNNSAENATLLNGLTFGGTGNPLYNRITEVTLVNLGGNTTALDQDNTLSNDQFTTNIGSGTQTFTFDASVIYNATVTYADGTTGTVTAVIAQDTNGNLYLAPETFAAPNPDTAVYEAKPIVSITLNSVFNNVTAYLGLGTDRWVTAWDDGWVDGTGGNDLINATYVEPISSGSDRIDNNDGINAASLNDDRIRAGAGDDTVLAGLGNDQIFGGTGNDSLSGEGGADTIYGEDGNDRLFGGADADQLFGGIGADSLDGGTGADSLYGEAGADTLLGGDGADLLDGGTENDQLFGGAGADSLYGGDGDDSLDGGTENDFLSGGLGSDTLLGGDGDDTLDGGDGADSLSSGLGNDVLYGGIGNDTIYFGAGDDTVYGGAGDDVIDDEAAIELTGANLIFGGAGNDTIWSGLGDDTLHGDEGSDVLSGEGGNDILYGGDGADTLYGGAGNDTLYGGAGADSLYGGEDRDLFIASGTSADFGDAVFGDGTGDDFDTLDLTAWGKALTNIYKDPLNPENGYVEFLDSFGAVIGTMTFTDIERIIPCFTPGTMILTERGEIPVETLVPGDMVVTRDHGPQPVRWVGRKELSFAQLIASPALRPVRIAAGAMGLASPARDMFISPQHRVLFEGPWAEMLFGEPEVLVAATHLVGRKGVDQPVVRGVTYIHLMFDRHEVILSDGLWSESFQPAARMVSAMDADRAAEILALFPDLPQTETAFPSARPTLKAHEARVLLAA